MLPAKKKKTHKLHHVPVQASCQKTRIDFLIHDRGVVFDSTHAVEITKEPTWQDTKRFAFTQSTLDAKIAFRPVPCMNRFRKPEESKQYCQNDTPSGLSDSTLFLSFLLQHPQQHTLEYTNLKMSAITSPARGIETKLCFRHKKAGKRSELQVLHFQVLIWLWDQSLLCFFFTANRVIHTNCLRAFFPETMHGLGRKNLGVRSILAAVIHSDAIIVAMSEDRLELCTHQCLPDRAA